MENSILFPAELHIQQIREIEEKLLHLIEFRGFEKVELDFTQCRIFFAESITPLVCFCLAQAAEGVKFTVKLPVLDKLKRLFTNCGWANLIAPAQFRDLRAEVADNIPAVRFVNQVQQDQLVNHSIDKLLRRVNHLRRNDLRALEWSINEICDNVLNHSESKIGGLFQLNFRLVSREVEFIVADAGIGIPDSLRSLRHKD